MKRYTPIILILISIAIFFVFIDPQYKEVKEIQDEKAENDNLLALSNDLKSKRQNLTNSFNSISPQDKETLRKLLPDTVDNVRLILDINNIAEDQGVIIRNIAVQGGQEEEERGGEQSRSNVSSDAGVITLSFSVIATYEVFNDLLIDLERSLRLVDITRLNINRAEGEFMNFTITLNTYWLR